MHLSFILAIDQGGQSTRFGLYDLQGKRHFLVSEECATVISPQLTTTHIEQDPHLLLASFSRGLEKVALYLAEASAQGHKLQVIAAGYSGQGSSLLCWHQQTGEPLSPTISWQDVRAADQLSSLLQANSNLQAEITAITGLRASPHFGASKYRWCLDNIAQVRTAQQENTLAMGPIVCFFIRHFATPARGSLTKSLPSIAVDAGHAQRTLLWDLSKNAWSERLLTIFGLRESYFPAVVPHQYQYGELNLGGVPCPLTVTARDQGASLFARGEPRKEAIFVNVGTGAFIQRVMAERSAPEGILVSPLWIDQNAQNNLYAWEATVNGAAAALPFIRENTGVDISPQELNAAFATDTPKIFWFLNAQGEVSAPWWKTGLQSRWSSQITPHEKILAWLESIQFQIKVNIDLMMGEKSVDRIQISGGFSQSDGFCQHLANLCGLVVERSDDTEASLTGIAFLAAGRPKHWDAERSKPSVFLPQEKPQLKARFNEWLVQMNLWLA